jgi:nucleotide-binding universal stress UspA family protein
MAALLARRFGADVVAVHVAHPPTLASLSGVPYVVESELVDETKVLGFLQPELAGVTVSVRVPEGSASSQIVELARVEHADLVVMATRGHDSVADRILGSHADHVVRNSPCPVLVVG